MRSKRIRGQFPQLDLISYHRNLKPPGHELSWIRSWYGTGAILISYHSNTTSSRYNAGKDFCHNERHLLQWNINLRCIRDSQEEYHLYCASVFHRVVRIHRCTHIIFITADMFRWIGYDKLIAYLLYFSFPIDPTVRSTFLSVIVGTFWSTLTIYGISQTAVQRFLSAKSLKDAKW